MRGDIELAGFVLTSDEWAAMDRQQRALLLRLGRDEPWLATAPARARADASHDEAYEAYELVLAAS